MNPFHELEPGPEVPEVVYALIEIPKGAGTSTSLTRRQAF